jgi:hypothetical protein
MLDEAKDRVLYVSPPYSSEGKRAAFLAGYESALRDISRGQLMPHHPEIDVYGRHLRKVVKGG